MSRAHMSTWVLALVLLAITPAVRADERGDDRDPRHHHEHEPCARPDSVLGLVQRMDRYMRTHKVDGVTPDARYVVSPSETIRQGAVCQLLAYHELYHLHHSRRIRREIVAHADYLSQRLDLVRSGTPFDGMLGYALLVAYEDDRDSLHLASGRIIMDELEAIPTSECVLNGGLMVAMATAEYTRLTGDPIAEQKTHDILAQLAVFHNADGSFPHWCYGTEDVHYTGWMSQELVTIGRIFADPIIEPTLQSMAAFLAGRIDAQGHTHYEEPCPGVPDCTTYYDSRRSGCWIDYDTRAVTVEPGYSALAFNHVKSPRFTPVLGFLLSLENGGTFKDKWDFIPPPSDPEYPWSIADTSVVNMSITFWSMAIILTGRPHHADDDAAWIAEDAEAEREEAAGVAAEPASAASAFAPQAWPWREVDRRFIAGESPRACCGESPAAAGVGGGPKRGNGRFAGGTADGVLALVATRAATPGSAVELRLTLPHAQAIALEVFDASGRRVRALLHGVAPAGERLVRWDRRDASGTACRSGLYFVRLRAGEQALAARVVVLQ